MLWTIKNWDVEEWHVKGLCKAGCNMCINWSYDPKEDDPNGTAKRLGTTTYKKERP
jgi:hypothetical protein